MGGKDSKEEQERYEFTYKDYDTEKPYEPSLYKKEYDTVIPRGTIFQKPVNVHPHIDGEYLRSKFPRPDLPLAPDHVNAILQNCLMYMERKASERNLCCEYDVPALFPGVPLYNRKDAVFSLYTKLIERPGIQVRGDPKKPYTLFISWAK